MPMKIRISADSTCDLTSELIEQYDIKITPLYILMDDRALRDGIECTREDIFAYTGRTGKLCGTAAVSIADYLDFFGEELKTHDQIVHFTISSDMSACFQNACDAAQEFPGRVFVVDSRNLSTGIGHLVIDGALLAREGKSGEEIKAILDERREKLNVSFVIDTLEYLRKGGRCSTVAALGANLLKLKPCIEVHEGKMSVAKKYRGTLAKAIESYVTDRIKDHDDFDKKRVFITDSGVDTEIVETVEKLLREYGGFEALLMDFRAQARQMDVRVMEDVRRFSVLEEGAYTLCVAPEGSEWAYWLILTFPAERQAEYALYAEFLYNSFSAQGEANG